MITKETVFKSVIAKKIEPIPAPAEIAHEYIELKKEYGQFINVKMYCQIKLLSVPTMYKYLREYRASK